MSSPRSVAPEPGVSASVEGTELRPLATGAVLAVGGATTLLLLVLASRYGYHRDELYFLEASRHPALGYVDQPPVAIMLDGLARVLLGGSVFGLRLIPAIADGVDVALAALICRELGGRPYAQVLTALLVGLAPVFLVSSHTANTTVFDQVGWSLTSLLVLRMLRTGNDRLWLAVGLVVGVALETKDTILLLLLALAVGFLLNRQSRLFRTPWLWAGAGIAVALWVPNLAWEATHRWAVFEMDRNLRREHSGLGLALKYPGIHLLMPNIFLVPIWLAGLWALWREERFCAYRAFAWAYGFLFVFLLVTIADKPYYMAPLYVVLFGAGAIVTEEVVRGQRGFFRRTRRRPLRLWRSPGWAIGLVVATGVLQLPVSLPILPASALATVPLQDVNYDMGENIGWPEMVDTVAQVYRSLPPDERAAAVIVTANYGEAGAIDRFGPSRGLPGAFSGHDTYWWWGPPGRTGPTVAVGFDRSFVSRYFRDVRLVVRIHNANGVANDEEGRPIWICTGRLAPWPEIWPDFKDYG